MGLKEETCFICGESLGDSETMPDDLGGQVHVSCTEVKV